MKRLALLLPLLALLLLALVIGLQLRNSDPEAFDKVLLNDRSVIDRTLPRLDQLDEAPVALTTALNHAGPKVLVNFFASWCVPCRAEHPELVRIAQERGLPIIGIAYKDQTAATQAFLAELGNPYDLVLVDADGRAGIDWGINGVPETYVVIGGTKILGKIKGPLVGEATLKRFDSLLAAAE